MTRTEKPVDDLILSQLADGELDNERAVETLLAILDDDESRHRLRQHLQLRKLNATWRNQTPALDLASVLTPASIAPPGIAPPGIVPPGIAPLGGAEAITRPNRMRYAAGLLAASVVGGLLVLTGVLAGRLPWVAQREDLAPRELLSPLVGRQAAHSQPSVHRVASTPGQRQQIAQVFAFHNAAAGPLKWYASDDKTTELSAADANAIPARPVVLVLRLTTKGSARGSAEGSNVDSSRDYVIVCRDRVPVTIPLPHGDALSPHGRLYLSPAMQGNEIGIRYSLTVGGDAADTGTSALAGRRNVGDELRPLGEILLGDRLVRVEASAWPLEGGVQ